MLVHMDDMLTHAYQNGYGIGAFNLVSLDFLKAIVDGATHCQAPVILSLAKSHFDDDDFKMIMPTVLAVARRASIPIAIHLDQGASLQSAITAIGLGCNSVMADLSNQTLAENINRMREVVNMAHSCGTPVEGKLGYVTEAASQASLKHLNEVVYPSLEEAQRYVAETGIDSLAISIGNGFSQIPGEPKLDLEHLAKLNQALRIPLVIQAETGLSEVQFHQLIANGVTKINYHLVKVADTVIYHHLVTKSKVAYTDIMLSVQSAVRLEVEQGIRVCGSAKRAKELLTYCRPWQSVEHLIIYNTASNLAEDNVLDMMQQGRQVLSTIPGVLEVFTGKALKEDAQYRYCWLIRFAHPAVIDSYREHPAHKNFADTRFRPNAKERISIDYLEITDNRKGTN